VRCHLGVVPQERTAEEHTTRGPRVTLDRAMRGRDVSRPDLDDERVAAEVIDELLARVDGRRPNAPQRG
jgi:hypothetical protein